MRASLEKLGGSIVHENQESGKEVYSLSFPGILLTDQGEELEQLLVRYLDHARSCFVSDPEIEKFRGKEIEAALGLSEQQSHALRLIIHFGHFWGNSASLGEGKWAVGVPYDIDDLPAVQDLLGFVHARALKNFDQDAPVGFGEYGHYITKVFNTARQEAATNEFSFVCDPNLRELLAVDWQEAQGVHAGKAWKSCVVLCGGILEGILLDLLRREIQEARRVFERLRQKSAPDVSRWDLADLVDVAKELNILDRGSAHLSHALREFRNLIHPGRQVRERIRVSREEADIAVSAVRMFLGNMTSRGGGQ